MEHSKNDESELEEGEINEDADDSKRAANRKCEISSSSSRYISVCRVSSSTSGPNAGKDRILTAAGKSSTRSRPILHNRRGKNSFLGRIAASRFYRRKEFHSDNRSGIGSQSSLPNLSYNAKIERSVNKPSYVPRISSTSAGYRNKQRPVFHSNANHKLGNESRFADADNDASYEDLLEQYRQIKCRLNDLNEEEGKQIDKSKSAEKSNKSHTLKLGNNKENWQQKQSQAKRSKSSSVHSANEHTSTSKGRHSSLPRTTQISRRKRTYECHKRSRRSKTNQEKYKQKQHEKENNKGANEDDEDLLELRNQALATLSKASTCNKIKEDCVENKSDNNDIPTNDNSQVHNVPIFNVLGDNYEQIAMDLDSDVCPDSPQEEDTSDNKTPIEDPQFGDDVDEEELRQQLLQSLVGKKRQQEQVENQVENELLVPSVTTALSSEEPSQELAEKYSTSLDELPKTITHNIITTAEPLVINLAEDSSSEEEGEKQANSSVATPSVSDTLPPGLEQLIKDARMQSEKKQISLPVGHKTPAAVQKLSRAQQQEYRKLKEEIAKRESVLKSESKDTCTGSISDSENLDSKLITAKFEINTEQERLQNLKIQLSRKRFIAQNSQAKVQKLKEQLAAAERVLAVDMQMIKISNAKIKEVQLSLHKKVLSFHAQQKKWLKRGNHVSENDKVKVHVNGTAKQNSVSKLRVVKENSVSALSNTPKAKMTAAEIMLERERLQKLEKKVALQLEELRKKSRKTLTPKKPVNIKVGPRTTLLINNNKRKNVVSFETSGNACSTKRTKEDVQYTLRPPKLIENSVVQNTVGKSQTLTTVVNNQLDNKPKLPLVPNHASLENMKDYQNISKQLDHYARLPVLLYSYQLCDIFWPKLEKLELDELHEDTKVCTSYLSTVINYNYISPLLHMHSYRLHPHFVSQAAKSLSSNTYANGLDIKSGLCRFDLLGTCNDDQCTWQHESHYKLTNEEIVADLLAYAPTIAGIVSTDDVQQCESKLMKTSAKILEECKNLLLEETCKEVVSKVNSALNSKAPNFLPLTKRPWKPHTKKQNPGSTEECDVTKQKIKELKCNEPSQEDWDFDNLITDADRRYYNLEETVIHRLEDAVAENTENIQLWLKLAYKCLHSSESDSLEQTLNVLSRALESNQDNLELWQNYLNLYAQHPSSKDVISVCKQALEWCPRYEIWWKYLQLTEGYQRKYDVCSSFLEYLMSSLPQQFYNKENISHCILEVLLYQVQLSVQVGKFEGALMTFKQRLKKSNNEDDVKEPAGEQNKSEVNCDDLKVPNSILVESNVRTNTQENVIAFEDKCNGEMNNAGSPACCDATETTEQCLNLKLPIEFMTRSDYCFAWLCYIYLTEFNSLPSVIFQNGEDHLGHVVSKNPFLVDWTQRRRLQSSKEAIKGILAQAACCCMSDEAESVDICFPLYFQIVTIELSTKNYALAVEICEKLLAISPDNISVWLLLSRVYAYQSLEDEMNEILMRAIVSVPCNPYICYAAALFNFTKGNVEVAKEMLENFVQSYFLMPNTKPSNVFQYTELLYCELLQHGSKRKNKSLPEQKDICISEENKVYFWLNYILYLQCCSSFNSVILMTFEMALASFHFPDALKIIWWQYLQFSIRHISSENNFKCILKLLNECKISIPTNVSLPHWPGKFKNDFGFQMTVVSFFLDNIASANDRSLAVEKFLKILPKSVALIHRAIYCYLVSNQEDRALSLIEEFVHNEVFSAHLWRIAIRLIHNTRDRKEVHKFYNQSLQVLPYSCILWLEFLLYEVSENHLEHVDKIRKECGRLQIDCVQS